MNTIRVKLTKQGKKRSVNRKVLTESTFVMPLVNQADIIDLLKSGNEVRLGSMTSGIRLFPCLDKDLKKVKVIAETMGEFRNLLEDEAWELTDDSTVGLGEANRRRKLAREEARECREALKHCVSPDTMVQCPKCGFEFRVGKVLSAVK